jgi:hypothetical protein
MLAGGHVGRSGAKPSPEWPVNKNTVQRTLCRARFGYCLHVQIDADVVDVWPNTYCFLEEEL